MGDSCSTEAGVVGGNSSMEKSQPNPILLASTLDTYRCTIQESFRREAALQDGDRSGDRHINHGASSLLDQGDSQQESNYFKAAQW